MRFTKVNGDVMIFLHRKGKQVTQTAGETAELCGYILSGRSVFGSSQLTHRSHSTLWQNVAQAPISLKLAKSVKLGEQVLKGQFCIKFLWKRLPA